MQTFRKEVADDATECSKVIGELREMLRDGHVRLESQLALATKKAEAGNTSLAGKLVQISLHCDVLEKGATEQVAKSEKAFAKVLSLIEEQKLQSPKSLTELGSQIALQIAALKSMAEVQSKLNRSIHDDLIHAADASNEKNAKMAVKLQSIIETQEQASLRYEHVLAENTAACRRFLSLGVATNLSAGVADKVSEFETRTLSPLNRPKSPEEAENLRQSLAKLMEAIPVWAEQDFGPTINRLNWSVQVLWKMQHYANQTPENLREIANQYRALADAAPEDTRLKELKSELTQALVFAETAAANFEKKNTVDTAKRLFQNLM